MKKFKLILATSLAMALAMPLLTAQETRVTTTTSQGVVSELVPDALVVTTNNAPVRYTFSKTTQYVDELGNPVSMEIVKSGVPVTVHYIKEANGLVASKVIVRKTTTTTPGVVGTTTTTTASPTETLGTVAEYGNGVVTVRTESSPTPVRYSFTKTTRYVDEAGNTVTAETVRSGAPVTIQYVKRGDQLEASTVIVRKVAVPAPGAAIIDKKTTTTTTTTKKEKKDKDDDDDDKD